MYSIGISSNNHMKQLYKIHNIKRWPYRKVNSLNTLINYHKEELLNNDHRLNEVQRLIITDNIKHLHSIKMKVIENPQMYDMKDINKEIKIVKIRRSGATKLSKKNNDNKSCEK